MAASVAAHWDVEAPTLAGDEQFTALTEWGECEWFRIRDVYGDEDASMEELRGISVRVLLAPMNKKFKNSVYKEL